MKMRKSRVLEKMRSGQVALSVKLNIDSIRNVELAALCGFDCIWVDMEHVPTGIGYIENAALAAKAHNCDLITRVSRGGYSHLIRPLEADSTGIMVPHVMSLEDARSIQYYTKFYPIGRRPLDGGNADGAYCLIGGMEYLQQANRERFVCIQIEDPEPLPELDEICALPGIDMVFFGPGDFSQGADIPFAWDHALILETRRRVADTARRHGKFAGTVGNPGNFDALVEEGFAFINLGSDVVSLAERFRNMVESCSGRRIR